MVTAAAAKSLQSCPTLCNPIDGSPPGSPVSGILQARTLEWVAISFSNAWKWKVKVKSLSHVRPSATSWTAAFQDPPSMGFSRQEYWSGGAIAFSRQWLQRGPITFLLGSGLHFCDLGTRPHTCGLGQNSTVPFSSQGLIFFWTSESHTYTHTHTHIHTQTWTHALPSFILYM